MDDTEVIKGRKRIVLEDCEHVIVKGGKNVQVQNVDSLLVLGCTDAWGDSTVWRKFTNNVADSEHGFVFD